MVTIGHSKPGAWPWSGTVEEMPVVVASDVQFVTLTGDALLLAHMEFTGLPGVKYINEYDQLTWYWGDAAFIVANLKQAWEVNKDATKRK